MLTLTECIKQIITDIEITGGAVIERITPSANLLQELRSYAIQQIRTSTNQHANSIILEWFTEPLFDEYVRVCVVHLHKLGISDDAETSLYIKRVIDGHVSQENLYPPSQHDKQDFDGYMTFSLFEIWEQMGDEQTQAYSHAQKRALIAWDYRRSYWKATSLGRMFLELSPVQAIMLLLSIDTLFSTGRTDLHHINPASLQNVLETHQEATETWISASHLNILAQFGILQHWYKDPFSYEDPGRILLTPVGYTILKRVVSDDNPFRDVAQSLIEAEQMGETFHETSSEIQAILLLVSQNELSSVDNQRRIVSSAEQYRNGNYLESITLLYPSIEAILDAMLRKQGQNPLGFNGMQNKAEWLGSRSIIPADVAGAIEVFTGRNKIVHGNYVPPADYVSPLCQLAFRYLRRLLTDYRETPATLE